MIDSFVNLLVNDDWSEEDILARVRAEVQAAVPAARQDELRNIFLGQLSGMRVATGAELTEIGLVAQLQERAKVRADEARERMSLLRQAWAVEAAEQRLQLPAVEPIAEGEPPVVLNQAEVDADATERAAALATIEGAADAVFELVVLRRPPAEEPAPEVAAE